jgi:hypothetical protein
MFIVLASSPFIYGLPVSAPPFMSSRGKGGFWSPHTCSDSTQYWSTLGHNNLVKVNNESGHCLLEALRWLL